MSLVYLGVLLASLAAMLLIDARYCLFVWAAPWRACTVLAVGLVFFLAWDLVGIGFGVFFRGDSPFMTGIEVAPHLPIEEIVFLVFLCQLTMVLVNGAIRILERRAT